MADMTRYRKKWLTDGELEKIGGEFEGVVESVTEELIRNKFKAQRSREPVVGFDQGGYRLVLNATLLDKFIRWFGAESDDWIGRRVRIYRRLVEVRNSKGELRSRWQRDAVCEDVHARAVVRPAQPPVASAGTVDDSEDGSYSKPSESAELETGPVTAPMDHEIFGDEEPGSVLAVTGLPGLPKRS